MNNSDTTVKWLVEIHKNALARNEGKAEVLSKVHREVENYVLYVKGTSQSTVNLTAAKHELASAFRDENLDTDLSHEMYLAILNWDGRS